VVALRGLGVHLQGSEFGVWRVVAMGALMVQTVVAFEGCIVQAEGLGALLIHVQISIVYIYMYIIKEI